MLLVRPVMASSANHVRAVFFPACNTLEHIIRDGDVAGGGCL